MEQRTRDSRRLNSGTGSNAYHAKHQLPYRSSISSPPATPTHQTTQVQVLPPFMPACPLALSIQRDVSNGLDASPMTPPTHTWHTVPFVQLSGHDHLQVAPSPYLPVLDMCMIPVAPMLYNPPMVPRQEHEKSYISPDMKAGYLSPARMTDDGPEVENLGSKSFTTKKEEDGLGPLLESTHQGQGAPVLPAS